MNSKQMKEKIFSFIIINICIFSCLMLFAEQCLALGEKTHRDINEIIADKSSTLDNFSLQQYLVKQLGMAEGVETLIY